jgi:hypothetical protein
MIRGFADENSYDYCILDVPAVSANRFNFDLYEDDTRMR